MENKEKNFISVVAYIHNNEKNIEKFLKQVNNELDKNFLEYEIILVNDCSTDKTIDKIKELKDEMENVAISIINMSFYQGKELAMNAGIDLAIGDFVYEFDNITIDYNPKVIMDIYIKILEDYDIVNARSDTQRYKTSKIFYKLFNTFANLQYKLDTDSFRILSRRAINRIQSIHKTIPYRKAVYANCGLKMETILYKSNGNNNNKLDRNTKKERKKNAIDALILFTDISYKLAIIMSILMMITTISVAIYAVNIFIHNSPVQGWTTTMLFLSFNFFSIFSIFAIIIKYLSIIINLIFKKSRYIVESIEKI